MTEYIIDMLGDIDEELLEEALDLPRQAEEIEIEVDERRDRSAFFAAVSAIAAGLAIMISIVIFRASFDQSDITASTGASSSSAAPESSRSGITIPTEFTNNDLDLQKILYLIVNDAEELNKHFFGGNAEFASYGNVVFPQLNTPVSLQLDKYSYSPYSDIGDHPLKELRIRLSESFTAEAVGEYMKLTAVAEETENSGYDNVLAVNIVEDGLFAEDGYLIEPPYIFELDDMLYELNFIGKSELTFSGYWSTAKIVSKTDTEIIFTYIRDLDGKLVQETGRLLNEDGWKLSWCGSWIL